MSIEDAVKIELTGCTLQGNNAGGSGGALSIVHAMRTIISGYFAENKAVHRSGGAIFGDYIDHLDVSGSFFYLNEAQLTGGAISAVNSNVLSMSDSIFGKNSAWNLHGGAVSVESSVEFNMKTCHFEDNFATSGGGAMWLHEIAPQQMGGNVSDSSFIENHASHDGGGLLIQGNIKSLLSSNQNQEQEIDVPSPILIVLKNTTLERNSAERGGALMVEEGMKS